MKSWGQTLVIVALVAMALVLLFIVALNSITLITANRALSRAAEDASVAALRTGNAGAAVIDATLADREARRVLKIETGNVHWMSESPDEAAAAASVVVVESSVTVQVPVHICPTLWTCVPMSVSYTSFLSTTLYTPATATPVPTVVLIVTPPTF